MLQSSRWNESRFQEKSTLDLSGNNVGNLVFYDVAEESFSNLNSKLLKILTASSHKGFHNINDSKNVSSQLNLYKHSKKSVAIRQMSTNIQTHPL